MSLSASDEGTGLEWAGALGASGLFPTTGHLRDRAYLRMLAEIPRFHRQARQLLDHAEHVDQADLTLGEFLDRGRFTPYFRRHFVEPLVAAVWSCDPAVATDYPAAYLFTFLRHHGMLRVFGSPTWRTVAGGSRSYVDRVAAAIEASGGSVRTGAPVIEVSEGDDSVTVRTATDEERYDAVVVATHPEQALALLADPSPVQRKVLGALPVLTQHRAAPHRHPAAAEGSSRLGVVELPAARRRPGLGAGDLRPDPPPAAADPDALPGHPRRRAPRRSRDRHRPPRLRAPALQPHLGRRPRPARRGRHRSGAVRRRLPRLGVPRGRRTFRPSSRRGARPPLVEEPTRRGRPGDRHETPTNRTATRRPSRTPGAPRSAVPSGTARTCGSSTSIGSPSLAGRQRSAGPSTAATTSTAGPRRSARVSTRSSTSTASTSAADGS